MKTQSRFAGLLLVSLSLPSIAQEGGHPPHWNYAGEVGPAHWAEFEPDFGVCSSGRNQSPVDLGNFIEADLPEIAFDYAPGGHEVVNNGHAVQVNYNAGSSITVDSTVFELKQFHFHSPSEHTINGKSFPMVAHFVHADAEGNLAVVALMFEEGGSNKLLQQVARQVPQVENGKAGLAPPVAATDLLHPNREYYRYNGSLTTPPCSEGVRWFVLKQPATATAEQLQMVVKAIGHPNNRPLQPIGARSVLK